MMSYSLKCRKNIESENLNKGRIMLSSKYAVCDSRKLNFIKKGSKRVTKYAL